MLHLCNFQTIVCVGRAIIYLAIRNINGSDILIMYNNVKPVYREILTVLHTKNTLNRILTELLHACLFGNNIKTINKVYSQHFVFK